MNVERNQKPRSEILYKLVEYVSLVGGVLFLLKGKLVEAGLGLSIALFASHRQKPVKDAA